MPVPNGLDERGFGEIKGVNSNTLDSTRDVGRDGNPIANNPNAGFAPDVFGYTLNYYDTVGISDYRPIDATNRWNTVTTRFESDKTGSDALAARKNLWNGNIGMMVTTIQNPSTYATLPQAMSYEYDQLNRLKVAKGFVNLNMATNTWQSGSLYANRYLNEFTYDANGNILTQVRHNEAGTRVENLSYKYERNANGHLLRNRLYHVNETVAAGTFSDDIDDQGTFTTSNINVNNNYGYDEEGRLIRDDAEDIAQIKWTVTSKVKEVIRTNGSPKKNLKFDYDAFGKRIAKHVYTSANVWESSTYYSYDATGNVMCIYEKKNDGAGITYHAAERFIYGSSRVGVNKERVELSGTVTVPDTGNYVHHIGKKQYELNNHLGNVLSTISDKLIAKDWNNDNNVDSYKAEILSATDYTPFGVTMDGRTFTADKARYGFNGKEKDDEWNVDGGSYDFGARMYDSRLGRFTSADKYVIVFAGGSVYAYGFNNPTRIVDKDGKYPVDPVASSYKGTGNVIIYVLDANEIPAGLTQAAEAGWDIVYVHSLRDAATWMDKTYGQDGKKVNNMHIATHSGDLPGTPGGALSIPNPIDKKAPNMLITSADITAYQNNKKDDSKDNPNKWDLKMLEIQSLEKISGYLNNSANVTFTACCMGWNKDVARSVYNLMGGSDKSLSMYFSMDDATRVFEANGVPIRLPIGENLIDPDNHVKGFLKISRPIVSVSVLETEVGNVQLTKAGTIIEVEDNSKGKNEYYCDKK